MKTSKKLAIGIFILFTGVVCAVFSIQLVTLSSASRLEKKVMLLENSLGSLSDTVFEDGQLSKVDHLLKELMDDSKPLISVCRSLRRIDFPQNKQISIQESRTRWAQVSLGGRNDPLIESMKPLYKFAMSQPKMQHLAKTVYKDDFSNGSVEEILGSVQSYQEAQSEIENSVPHLERILDETYLTLMLGRAVDAYPELANNSNIHSYCEEIESQINLRDNFDFEEAKKRLSTLLEELEVDQEKIGFDPHYKSHLKVVFVGAPIFFGGWLKDVLSY